MTRMHPLRQFLPALALASAGAHAIPPIPAEDGWSGLLGAGVGAGRSETNMQAVVSSIDLGKKTISSLDSSPDDEDLALPSVQFEIGYKFEGIPTQLYLNNQLADHATFDLETSLLVNAGIRQGIGQAGVVDFSFGVSSVPLEVWKDPYVVGSERGNTERTLAGVEVIWDDIFGSGFELAYSSREIEIDDEQSGKDGGLGLTGQEQRLLRREGNINRVTATYDWQINERHTLIPGIGYLDHDLDGDAMAEDGPVAQLQHVYEQPDWSLVSSLYFQKLESDTRNPIYNKQGETDTVGGSVTLVLPEPFDLRGWTAHVGAMYYEGDNNIDFYDSSFGMVSVGMLYRFD